MVSPMKEAICYVMEHFCVAINYYYKNWKACSFPREAESQLCSPLVPIYRRLVGDWMNDEETQVQEASMKALWPMFGVLIRRQEQQEEIVKNVPQLLAGSRSLDSFLVAKRLRLFLDVCEECKPPMPKKTFQAVCDFVFKQVLPLGTSVQQLHKWPKLMDRFLAHGWKSQNPEAARQRQIQEGAAATQDQVSYQHSQVTREHRDVLVEAFSHLVCCSPVDALDFLQTQMKDDTEYVRVVLLKHLKAVIASDNLCEGRSRKRPIVDAVKCILDDHREAVIKATLGFIRELLRSQNVEGCAVWDMVAYVFQQFSQPGAKAGRPGQKENEGGIQEICIDVLEHLNTSAEGMSKILWPKLLHFVVPPLYSPALRPLCRCLKELATAQQGESALFLGSCKGVRLPSAQGLFARLLVLASNPNQTGKWALQLLHAIRGNIHSAVNRLWGTQILFLWESIPSKPIAPKSQEWEQKLLQFLRRSLETIADSNWTRNLSREFESQMSSYPDQSAEKSFLYKSLGTSLTSCEDMPFVKSQIQHIVGNANYQEASEREKVILVLSFSAMGHFDLTLATLQKFGDGLEKKTKVFEVISHYKDYYQGRRGQIHQTLMLTYGKVALCAPKELLFSQVETDIMKRVLQHYYNSRQVLGVSISNKDISLKLAFIQSMTDIGHALHETRDCQGFPLTCKKEILGVMLGFIREEPLDSLTTPIRPKAILALGCLSKLKPCLSLEDNRNLLDQSIKSLFPLPPVEQLKEEMGKDLEYTQHLYDCSVEALGKLMKAILEEQPTSELVDEMFQLIDPWFTETECSRERALHASFQLLAAFQESLRVGIPSREDFQQFGSLVALLAPFTCDSSSQCRQWAGQCITCLIHIQARSGVTPEEEQEMLSACQDLWSEVPSVLFMASSRMAKVVSACFPPDQALDFIEAILEELVSGNEMCAVAAGYWLLTILQDRGDAMEAQVSKILDVFYSRLPTVKEEPLRQVLVDAISIMAQYHLDAVFSSLLGRRLPMDSETGELWRSLGRNLLLAVLILHRLAATVLQPPSSETASATGSDESSVFADEEPLKATCAIYEVLSMLPTGETIEELFPGLFCALLQQVSRTVGQKMPFYEGRRRLFRREQHLSEGNPCRLSVASLKTLLLKLTSEPSLAETGGVNMWVLLRDPGTHQEGVCLLTSHLVQRGLLDKEIIEHVLSWMDSESKKLRLTSTAFFVEAIRHPTLSEREPLQTIFPVLLGRAGDQQPSIRQMAVRGLGNVLLAAPDKIKEARRTVVEVLLGALYDAQVVRESLRVLAVVLPHLKEKILGSCFKNITMRTLSYLDDDDAELRGGALRLFGILAAVAKPRFQGFFADQVKKNLVPLLIHQQDPSPLVSEACRVAFLQSVWFLPKRKLRHCLEDLRPADPLNLPYLHAYICRQLVKTSPEMKGELLQQTAAYFRSSWEETRVAALDLSGVVLESMVLPDLDETFQLQLLGSLISPFPRPCKVTGRARSGNEQGDSFMKRTGDIHRLQKARRERLSDTELFVGLKVSEGKNTKRRAEMGSEPAEDHRPKPLLKQRAQRTKRKRFISFTEFISNHGSPELIGFALKVAAD
ncbi:LOW QUALITY PROTEIN: maestro heat-like repeat-containing protein family member 2B [Heteronotia binoei]|uniref:LOW QUALITY PROTEIN: maestro heat-like repeat-containing protein family member 2B n=1 Tax=Heteronotia binoei TaxID=13085 RepID=UPI0029318A9B|nr:LOW QUALITY PROTEIN: maestro heat-like repeat-containing protein family member 2B [Heteronotia binoei]